jgi:release factor glutamine methyltransferase
MQQFLKQIKSELKEIYSEAEIQQIVFLLIEKLTGWERSAIIINKNTIFSVQQRELLHSFIEKLKKHVPVQYIIGSAWFYGSKFDVNPDVLIPRPETEELVDWIVKENENIHKLKILDIGTGSGCIAVSLKSVFVHAEVEGWDISEKALETATKNAKNNKCDVAFGLHDILKPIIIDKQWNIIVSNPPYIPFGNKIDMNRNVLEYEPHSALFVEDENPLIFYEAIADFALKHLLPGGQLYFEIHKDMGDACLQMLKGKGFMQISLRKDISGNDRMINAKFS